MPTSAEPADRLTAHRDDALACQVTRTSPLTVDDDLEAGRFRAASGLDYVAGRFAAVASLGDAPRVLVTIDPSANHRVRRHTLPTAGDGGDLDLNACVTEPTSEGQVLLLFGSGQTGRDACVVHVDWEDCEAPTTTRYDASMWYDALRDTRSFAGGGLHVAGAVFIDDATLRLVHHAEATPDHDVGYVNATGDLPWHDVEMHLDDPQRQLPPVPKTIRQYDLGTLDGARLAIGDAACVDDYNRMLIAASTDAGGDAPGEARSVVGVVEQDGAIRWAELHDADGAPFAGRVEGLCVAPDAPDTIHFVIDSDDPERAAALYAASLDGPWYE